MRIGELAERLAVNPKTIRYCESIGLLPEPERTPSGYRAYTETDVDRVAFIKTAQRLSITLDEVREILALRERGERPCAYVRDVLRREVAAIDKRAVGARRRGVRVELVEPTSAPRPSAGRLWRRSGGGSRTDSSSSRSARARPRRPLPPLSGRRPATWRARGDGRQGHEPARSSGGRRQSGRELPTVRSEGP